MFHRKMAAPHVLIELSLQEMKCHTHNSILIQGLLICPNTKNVLYTNIKYGSHIKSKKSLTLHEGKQLFHNIIQIEKMKSRYIMILAEKKECIFQLCKYHHQCQINLPQKSL
jgi:hypothetical protein